MLPTLNSEEAHFAALNLGPDDRVAGESLPQWWLSQAFLNNHLLTTKKPDVTVRPDLPRTIAKLGFHPVDGFLRVACQPSGDLDARVAQMSRQNRIELPRLVFGHCRLNSVTARLERCPLETNWKESSAGLLSNCAGEVHFDSTGANEGAMFSALTDAGLKVPVQIPRDWLAHCAENQHASICDGVQFRWLKKPEPFDRHFDEGVGQPLFR